MPVQCCFYWHDSDDPKIWERIKAERLAHILLPHCSKPTRRDWEKNVSETLMATVWARRIEEGGADAELPKDIIGLREEEEGRPMEPKGEEAAPLVAGSEASSLPGKAAFRAAAAKDGWEWAGICYLSNGFGMTPYVHFALFRAWRSEAESIGREALAWIFRTLKCPAVLGWTPACFRHVEPLLRAWGFRDLAVIPQGFAFVEREGGGLYFRDGVLRIRKK